MLGEIRCEPLLGVKGLTTRLKNTLSSSKAKRYSFNGQCCDVSRKRDFTEKEKKHK